MMMRSLDDFSQDKVKQPGVSVGEAVRNSTFDDIKGDLGDRQQEIFEIILNHSPDGISSMGIHEETGKPLHTFSGRITELANPKLKDTGAYCIPPLIEACGVEIRPDHDGKMRKYTKYRVVGSS